jgi:DNA-directed RNA polymerase sigma subunit (sigma70/sigma32)
MEIAQEIGISQAQVSRIEKGALERMRKQFYNHEKTEDDWDLFDTNEDE